MEYKKSSPLLFVHVPKSAGTSLKKIFAQWFGERFFHHYILESESRIEKFTPESKLFLADNSCVFGHFNRLRGYGIEKQYPNVNQFITILREPYAQFVSEYFYKGNLDCEYEFRHYLDTRKPNYLNHFPIEINNLNYKYVIDSVFLYVGIFEYLQESLFELANVLGKPIEAAENLPRLKKGAALPLWVDKYKERFQLKNPVEMNVYNYALSKFSKS